MQKKFRLLNYTIFCLVFFGFPIILASYGLKKIWNERENNRKEIKKRQVEALLTSFDVYSKTENFLEIILTEFSGKVLWSSNFKKTFRVYSNWLKRKYPSTFEFVFLGKDGYPISELSDGPPRRKLYKDFYDELKLSEHNPKEAFIGKIPRFKSLIGPLLTEKSLLYYSNKLIKVSCSNSRSMLFISRPTDQGILLVFVNSTPSLTYAGISEKIKILQKKYKSIFIALIDSEKPLEYLKSMFERAADFLESVHAQSRFEPGNSVVMGNWCWNQRVLSPTMRLLAAIPYHPDKNIEQTKMLCSLMLSFIFSILAIVAWLIMSNRWEVFISLKLKLIFLVLYILGLPITVLSITAYNSFKDRQESLEAEMLNFRNKALTNFDKLFPQTMELLHRTFKKVFSLELQSDSNLIKIMEERIASISKKIPNSNIAVFNKKGDVLYRNSDDPGFKKALGFFRPFFKKTLSDLSQELGDDAIFTGAAMIGGLMQIDLESMLTAFWESLSRLTEVKFGNQNLTQGIFPIYIQKKPEFGVFFTTKRKEIEKYHVRKYLLQFSKHLPFTKLYAVNRTNESYSVPCDFPKKYKTKFSGFFASKELKSGNLLTKFSDRKKNFLLSAIHGEELSEYDLVALATDNPVRIEMEQLQKQLLSVLFFMVFISLTVGSVFAQKFLKPVGSLNAGVKALRIRDFEFRVPAFDRDELGDLANAFNEMMESMADLEIAKIIQESLFPKEPLKLKKIEVFGKCVSAAQVGGDYFDYFALGEDKVAVVIGDVAGHGASAGLVMSMAKALVAEAAEKSMNSGEILNVLNRIFLKTLAQQRPMTCFFAIIDLSEYQILYSNAAHNDPFIVRGKEIIPLKSRGFPLGVTARAIYRENPLAIKPGDLIFLFTDGLIEAPAKDGAEVGIERLHSFLASIPDMEVLESESVVRKWNENLLVPGPAPDDVTIMIAKIV
ncbi:MAG: SpoIIE family protein phosphatase [Candidatus Riflebacteria bacterium]|nr:SpoIIE family protein phosphatase [Candidatus Riflebacteria bacterium]